MIVQFQERPPFLYLYDFLTPVAGAVRVFLIRGFFHIFSFFVEFFLNAPLCRRLKDEVTAKPGVFPGDDFGRLVVAANGRMAT